MAVHMWGLAGISDAGKELWQQLLPKLHQKNSGLRMLLARSTIKVRILTRGGLSLGTRDAIKLDHDRLNNVVRKIIRGLYFHEFGEALRGNARVDCIFVDDQTKADNAAQFAPLLRGGTRYWPGLFEYLRGRVRDKTEGSMWLLRFYGCITYWAMTAAQEDWQKIVARQSN